MGVSHSTSPWPPGSSPPNPPYDTTIMLQRWSEAISKRIEQVSVFTGIARPIPADELNFSILHIPRPLQATTQSYELGTTLTVDRPGAYKTPLNLMRADAFSFLLDDVLAAQSKYDLFDAYLAGALRDIVRKIETAFLPGLQAHVAAANQGATAGVRTNDLDLGTSASPVPNTARGAAIGRALTALSQYGIPQTERWVLMPATKLLRYFEHIDFHATPDLATQNHNALACYFGYTPVFVADWLARPSPDNDMVFVGHKDAIQFGARVVRLTVTPDDNTMGTRLNGVVVSGFTVVDTTALALLRLGD